MNCYIEDQEMDSNAKISMISVIIKESFWNQSITKCLEDIQIFHGNQAIVVTCSELRENDVVVYKNKEIGAIFELEYLALVKIWTKSFCANETNQK